MERTEAVSRLEELVGYGFKDSDLARLALRHGSAANAASDGTYQRLEFLGDAVLGAAVALLLYRQFPDADQGALTRMRSHLIRSRALAIQAAALGLDQLVEVGVGEQIERRNESSKLLEDVFEAVVGAVLLDGGFDAAFGFVERQLAEELEQLDERSLRLANPKTTLQEEAQARGLPAPSYRQVRASGPDHSKLWVFEVLWDGEEVARGEGRSKRDAQEQAARRALERLGLLQR